MHCSQGAAHHTPLGTAPGLRLWEQASSLFDAQAGSPCPREIVAADAVEIRETSCPAPPPGIGYRRGADLDIIPAHGGVFDNIVGANGASLAEAWEAARMAELGRDLRQMTMQMHTMASEGGANFSGGQRQSP